MAAPSPPLEDLKVLDKEVSSGYEAGRVVGETDAGTEEISEHDLQHLKRVSGHIPWQSFTIAFVEMCERFSYYGTTAVCKCLHHYLHEMWIPGPCRGFVPLG